MLDDDRDGGVDPANCKRCAAAVPPLSLQLSLSLAVFKFIVGYISKSTALIGDAMNSSGSALDSGVTQVLIKRSSRPADAKHPFGRGKSLHVGTFYINVLLALVGAAIVVVALIAIVNGTLTRPPLMALTCAVVAAGASLVQQRYFQCVAARNESSAIARHALASRADTFASLVVLVGIAGALLVHPILDPAAAIVVGALRSWGSLARLPSVAQSLIDRGLGAAAIATIERRALNQQGVLAVAGVRSRQIGDAYWVEVGIQVEASLPVRDAESVIESLHTTLSKNSKYQHVEIVVSPYAS